MSLWNFHRRWMAAGLPLLLLGFACTRATAAPITLYSTQFENFNPTNDIIGQNQWIGAGEGGNGFVEEFYPGFGLSAYIGFAPPTTNGLLVWRPVNHVPTNRPIVDITLDMAVIDSTTNNNNYDEFRWSVYNIAGQPLFSIVFDNRDFGIYHLLDDAGGQFRYTGWGFDHDTVYTLNIQLNYASNRWNAWLGGAHIITNELITTKGAAQNFGDLDAVWLRGGANAGDNFMVFDNLLITADLASVPAPTLNKPLAIGGGQYLIRVNGTEGVKFAVQASTNLTSWIALKTNVISGGYFDYLDTTAVGLPRRYYRAKWIP